MRTGSRSGKQSPEQSTMPIIQLDFAYLKGFDDSKVHPILTAIDIQSGMMMALQLSEATTLSLRRTTATAVPGRVRQNNTCDTAIRSGRLLDRTYKGSGKHNGEHNYTHFTGIQFTIKRRRRTGTPHTFRTDTNTEGTNVPELQQDNHHETPHHAVDSATQRLHREQICHTRKRIHKLLQQMAQRATYSTV